MRIIFTKFDKKSINSLPRILFPGKIVLIDKAEDTEEAVNFLLSPHSRCRYGDPSFVQQGQGIPGFSAPGEHP